MAVEQLKDIKFHNSIRLNLVENTFFKSEQTDIWLDGIVVKLVDRNSKDVMYSSLMNVIAFKKMSDFTEQKAMKKEKAEKAEKAQNTPEN